MNLVIAGFIMGLIIASGAAIIIELFKRVASTFR